VLVATAGIRLGLLDLLRPEFQSRATNAKLCPVSDSPGQVMNLDLSGKTAVVCGSTQGIGLASAIEIAQLNANVCLVARNRQSLETAVAELPCGNDQRHEFLVADFSDPSQLQQEMQTWTEQGNSAEILVNNTGGPPAADAMDSSLEDFRVAFNNHLICNQILVQALVPGMKAQQFGRIINVISIGAKIPIPGLGVSNTIRGAVASWGKTLATELAPFGITVNNMLPGLCWTGRLESLVETQAKQSGQPIEEVSRAMQSTIPARRFGLPTELAAVVAFLASPAAAYVTGINIPVDGGRTPCL